MSLFKYSIQGP